MVGKKEPEELQLTEMEQLRSIYSDLHKDVFGCRPINTVFATTQDAHEAIQDLVPLLEEQENLENELESDNWDNYQKRIQKTANDLNVDQATVIRWDFQAEGIDFRDVDFYCYLNGLKYTRASSIKEMLQ